MITVQLTCESHEVAAQPEASGGPRYRPVIAANGQRLWEGRPEASPDDAERVALAYLRYALGGLLQGPAEPGPERPGGEAQGPGAAAAEAVTEAVEALARDVVGALRRVGDFFERGEWRRFLG